MDFSLRKVPPIILLLILFTVRFLLSAILLIIPIVLAKKTYLVREKLSPYETGFSPITKSRNPFSLRFFIITILFLIFDVEIVLLLPLITTKNIFSPLYSIILRTVFIYILIVGLFHE